MSSKKSPVQKDNVNLARVFLICSEKGSELLKGDSHRKFQGRCVLQGDNVRDETCQTDILKELSLIPI